MTRRWTSWTPLWSSLTLLIACSGANDVALRSADQPPQGTQNDATVSPAEPPPVGSDGGVDPCDWERGGQLGLPRCPNTGDAIPATPATNEACRDGAPGANRWLAMEPHTPLAITDSENGILRAGQPCCAPWAHRGDSYRSLDEFGQIVGSVEISGGAGYDATRCFELGLDVTSGRDAERIYVSTGGGWQPSPSVEWTPEADVRASFAEFIRTVTELTVVDAEAQRHFDREPPLPPLEERTLFFRVDGETAPGGRDDGRNQISNHYAVVGGRLLVVAWYSPEGKWILTHIENDLTNFEYSPILTYRPVSVVDMDGDGVPEIIFHWDEGPGWAQVVLQRRSARGGWEQVAQSVGGSTA